MTKLLTRTFPWYFTGTTHHCVRANGYFLLMIWYSRSGLAFLLLSGTWWDAKGPGWWRSFSPHGEVRELKSSANGAKNVVGGQRSWNDKSLSTKYIHIKPMITQRDAYKNRPWAACSHRTRTLLHCYGLLLSDPRCLWHGKVSGQVTDCGHNLSSRRHLNQFWD